MRALCLAIWDEPLLDSAESRITLLTKEKAYLSPYSRSGPFPFPDPVGLSNLPGVMLFPNTSSPLDGVTGVGVVLVRCRLDFTGREDEFIAVDADADADGRRVDGPAPLLLDFKRGE